MAKKNNREQQAAALGYDLEKDSAPKILPRAKAILLKRF